MLDLSVPFNLSAFVATLILIVVLALLTVDVFATKGKRIKTAAKAIGIIGIVLGAVAVFCCVTINTDMVTIRGMQAADIVLVNWDAIAVVFGVEIPYIGRVFLLFTAPVMWALTALEMGLSIALTLGGFLPDKKKAQTLDVQEQAVVSPMPKQEEEEQIVDASLDENEEPTAVTEEEPLEDEEQESFDKPQEETPLEQADEEQAEVASADTSEYEEQAEVASTDADFEETEVASTDTADYEENAAEDEQEPTDNAEEEINSEEETNAEEEVSAETESADTSDDEEMGEMLDMMEEINGVLDRSSSEIDPSEYFTDFIDGEDEQEEDYADDYEEQAEEETQDAEEQAEDEEPIAETTEPETTPKPEPTPASTPEPEPAPEPEKRAEEPRVAATEVVTRVIPKKPPQELNGFTTIQTAQSGAAKSEQPPSDAKEAVLPRGGLPQSRRHILMNRRNVVNMFSEYLNSKTKEEKERIESSINTIILK